jgi:hypothetical protein
MSLQASHHHQMERHGQRFYSDGVLQSTDVAANKAQAEAVVCERCGKQVHPTNWMKHQQSDHSDDPKPLHDAHDRLPLAAIRTDGGTQPRALIDTDTVEDYAEQMNGGATFPSIIVFFDGQDYWLADGFHRVAAAKKLAWLDLPADVRQGTQRDAVLFSVGVNATHGLRRTNADKHRAVERLLRDEEWSKWSNYEIAKRCAVSESYVRKIRPHYAQNVVTGVTYTTKHGTQATMSTGNIGKGQPPVTRPPGTEPDIHKVTEQANRVFAPVTTPVTYGKVEDDYQPDVPETVVDDEPEAAEPEETPETVKFDIGDKVRKYGMPTIGEVWNTSEKLGVYVKFPPANAAWFDPKMLVMVTPFKGEQPKPPQVKEPITLEDLEPPAAEPFQVGDKVNTHLGRTGGVVLKIDERDPLRTYVEFSGDDRFWTDAWCLRLVEHSPYVESKPKPATYAHHLSGTCEWYTPKPYVEAARTLMAGIDLDPASCEFANLIVKAKQIYTLEEDGLDAHWYGSVFLNPPYGLDDNGDSIAAQWVNRLVDEYECKNVREAVLLVNATTERKWFQPLWQFPICFTDHRIAFYNADGQQKQPTQGNAFVYLGKHPPTFAEAFRPFGTIVQRV